MVAVRGVCVCLAALEIWENGALVIKDSCARSCDGLRINEKTLPSGELHHRTTTFRTGKSFCTTEQGINLILFSNFLSYIHNRDSNTLWRLDQATRCLPPILLKPTQLKAECRQVYEFHSFTTALTVHLFIRLKGILFFFSSIQSNSVKATLTRPRHL